MSQQHAHFSQGQICLDKFMCCHTEKECADQTLYLTQSRYTDTRPASPSADPITQVSEGSKRDMKALDIKTKSWEDLAAVHMMWRGTLNQHLKTREKKLVNVEVAKRACRKECNNS